MYQGGKLLSVEISMNKQGILEKGLWSIFYSIYILSIEVVVHAWKVLQYSAINKCTIPHFLISVL